MNRQTVGLWKKIFVNVLTLARIPLTILFNAALTEEKNRPLACVALFSLIVLTDLFDGKLARRFNVTSKTGAVLDVSADFFFVFSASYHLYKQGLIPFGMIVIVLMKFAEFCLTSYLLNRKRASDRALFFDKIGRSVALIMYSVPPLVIVLYSFLQRDIFDGFVLCLFVVTTLLSMVSLWMRVSKLTRCKRDLQQ